MAYRKAKEKLGAGRLGGIEAENGEKIMRSARMGNLEETEEVLKWWAGKDAKGLLKDVYGNEKLRVNTSVTGSENYVLRKAVEYQQSKVVALMIEYKADPNIGNTGDYCPNVNPPCLHMASQKGDQETVKLLLAAGANVMVEVDGRKAKTIAADDDTYKLIREVEVVELEKRAVAKAAEKAAKKAAAAAKEEAGAAA